MSHNKHVQITTAAPGPSAVWVGKRRSIPGSNRGCWKMVIIESKSRVITTTLMNPIPVLVSKNLPTPWKTTGCISIEKIVSVSRKPVPLIQRSSIRGPFDACLIYFVLDETDRPPGLQPGVSSHSPHHTLSDLLSSPPLHPLITAPVVRPPPMIIPRVARGPAIITTVMPTTHVTRHTSICVPISLAPKPVPGRT